MTDPDPTAPGTRSIVVEGKMEAPPSEVWSMLTTAEGLERWFPPSARVEPGEGGTVWLSWGPGMEGEARIHIWSPPARFGWTESQGQDESGHPIKVAVDFYIEGREGVTVVRLVQSGLSDSEDWDEMYDALRDGWTYFLFNLAFYFLRHRGRDRRLVWHRVATDLARDALWERLLQGALIGMATGPGATFEVMIDQSQVGAVVSQRSGYHFAGTLPDLDDGLLFVELEGEHVGIWLSTYGMDEARVRKLQQALDARVEEVLGTP